MAGEKIMSGNMRLTLDGKTIYHATEASLSLSRATKERTTKDIEGRQVAKGIKSFSASASALGVYASDGVETHDFKGLFDLFNDDSDTQVQVEFVPDEADATYKLQGSGIITSLELNAPNEEDTTASISIEGGAMASIALPVV